MIKLKRSSDFAKNVMTLLTGQALAQGFPILLAPVLARLYSPEDYGILDLVIAIVSILSTISCGKYEMAIMLPEDKRNSYHLTILSIIICLSVCITSLILMITFLNFLPGWLGIPDAKVGYLFFIPLLVAGTGFFTALKYFNLKSNNYALIAKSTTAKSLISVGVQLGLGIAKLGSLGLLLGQLSSHLVANFSLIRTIKKFRAQNHITISGTEFKILALKYIEFPRYSVPGALANSIVLYLPSVFISKNYSLEMLGLLALSNRMLSVPLNMINASVGDAFLQKVSNMKGNNVEIKNAFVKMLRALTMMVILPTILGMYYLDDVFRIIFGYQWEAAGTFGAIMIPYFAARFICSPLSNILVIHQKQKLNLILTILQVVLMALCFLVTIIYTLEFSSYLWTYVISQVLFYIFYLYQCWVIVNKKAMSHEKEH